MKLAQSLFLVTATAISMMAIVAEAAPSDDSSSLVPAIATAADPSTAVSAYAKALAGGADQIAAERAYLLRMTEFGLPEMADAQAQDLLLKDPDNGLAWGVAAHMSARRGSMAAAIGQIETAANRAPDNPFVLRTAGGIFAWYDSRGAGADIPDVIKAPIPDMKQRLRQQQTFATAYDAALKDYQDNPPANAPMQASTNSPPPGAPPATQAATLPPPPEVYVAPQAYPAASYVYDAPTYYYPPVYTTSYDCYPYSSPCWYPSYSPWCGPWFGFGASFVFVSNNGNDCDWNGNDWNKNGNWNGNKNGNWNNNWNSSGRGFAHGGMPDASGHTLRSQSARSTSSNGFVGPAAPQPDSASTLAQSPARSRGNGGFSSDGRGGFTRSRSGDAPAINASRSSGSSGGIAAARGGSSGPTPLRAAPARGPQAMGPARPTSSGGGSAPSVRSSPVRSSGGGNSGAIRSSGSSARSSGSAMGPARSSSGGGSSGAIRSSGGGGRSGGGSIGASRGGGSSGGRSGGGGRR